MADSQNSKDQLSAKDLVDTFLKLNDTINFYWNFYVVSVSGLVFWMLSTEDSFKTKTQTVVTIGFVVFALMNASGLYKHYLFFNEIRQALAERLEEIEFSRPKIIRDLRRKIYLPHWVVLVIHAISDLIILIMIWRFS